MLQNTNNTKNMLTLASQYAKSQSGCLKVQVGAVIVKNDTVVALGANRAIPDKCRGERGCLRIEKYGDNAKTHRNPEDCRAIHSEIDAIINAKQDLTGATIYITRYPCEACARAIIDAGITLVVYGREQPISNETARMFDLHEVGYWNQSSFKEEDNEG